MFKFATIGAFDNAINIPYCDIASTVTDNVYNGMGMTIDRTKKTTVPTTAESGKGDVYVVYNELRTYDYDSFEDFHFVAGQKPLLFRLASIAGYEVQFKKNDRVMADPAASLTAGTTLLAYGANGKLAVIASTSGYAVWLKVVAIEGDIVRAEVITTLPQASA